MIVKRINSMVESWPEYPHRDGGPSHLEKSEYSKIIRMFMKKLAYEIITTGDKIVLPYRMGAMQAVKYKTDKTNFVDYKATKDLYGEHNRDNEEEKKTVKHTNRATGGYWCRIHWYKERTSKNRTVAKFHNYMNYQFELTRPNRRPNSYNRLNPKVSLIPYFREKGWLEYKEITR